MAGVSNEIINVENNNAGVNSSNSVNKKSFSVKKVSANTSANSTYENT